MRSFIEFWLILVYPVGPRTHVVNFSSSRMHNWDRYTQRLAEFSRWFPDLCGKGYLVVKAKWKPSELPLPKKTVNKKQYHIPGGLAEISAAISDLKDAEQQFPPHLPLPLLSGQINTSPGTWYAAIDLARAFFFLVSIYKNHQKQFVFSQQGQQYTFTVSSQGYNNSLALCYSLV